MLFSVSVELLKRFFTGGAGFPGRFPPSFAFQIGNSSTDLGVPENGIEIGLHQLLTLWATQAASLPSETEIDMKNGELRRRCTCDPRMRGAIPTGPRAMKNRPNRRD